MDIIRNPRYLINVGVFSAVYFIVMFAAGIIGFLTPAMIFVGWVIGLLLNGTVVMLFLAKTPVFGALTLLGVIVGALMVITGHVWFCVIACALTGLLGDAIAASGKYKGTFQNALCYAVFSLWLLAPSRRSSMPRTPIMTI